jgi:hypothetical protein
MSCGFVKMEYQSCGMCRTPAVQDLGNPLEYFFTEVASVESFPVCEPIDEDGAVDAQEHCEYGFSATVVCTTFVGTSADTRYICRRP